MLGTVEDTWIWNAFAEPEAYEASAAGSPVYAVTFQRDRLGRITSRNEQVGAAVADYAYGYDLAGRLETVTVDGVAASIYAFESNGNRTEHHIGAASPLRDQCEKRNSEPPPGERDRGGACRSMRMTQDERGHPGGTYSPRLPAPR